MYPMTSPSCAWTSTTRNFFSFDNASIRRDLPKGERLYSMGNPLDLGFTIIEGTYNGRVEHSYNEGIHFSGALNPGMSGGPAVTAEGQVVGVNVATRRGGQLVSFLVLARFAEALLQRVRNSGMMPDMRAGIARQIRAWGSALYKSFDEQGYRSIALGPYRAPEAVAPWFNCWAQTNAGATPQAAGQHQFDKLLERHGLVRCDRSQHRCDPDQPQLCQDH